MPDALFDAYMDLDNIDMFYENIDVYDSFHEGKVKISIDRVASYCIDVGLDFKSTLIKKASFFNLYKEFVVADANKKLPFKDGTFKSVFSNIIYWLEDPYHSLNEINRVLLPGGEACIMVLTSQIIKQAFFYNYYMNNQQPKEYEFLKIINRGRSDSYKSLKSISEWEQIITETGFTIKEKVPHLSSPLLKIWDIGLRPIFPVLKEMVDAIDKEKYLTIKEKWVGTFDQLLKPIIDLDRTFDPSTCGYVCFILKK